MAACQRRYLDARDHPIQAGSLRPDTAQRSPSALSTAPSLHHATPTIYTISRFPAARCRHQQAGDSAAAAAAVSLRDLRLVAAGRGESKLIRSPSGAAIRGLARAAGSPSRLGSLRERRTDRTAAAGVLDDSSVSAERRAAPAAQRRGRSVDHPAPSQWTVSHSPPYRPSYTVQASGTVPMSSARTLNDTVNGGKVS